MASDGFLEELLATAAASQEGSVAARRKPQGYPSGWEPSVQEGESTATAVSVPYNEPTENDIVLLKGWGLDPEVWEIIDGTLICNRWQGMTGADKGNEPVWMYQYKARCQKRDYVRFVDVEELFGIIEDDLPPEVVPPGGPWSMVVCLADWQIGKGPEGTGGSGVKKTVKAIKKMIADVEARIRELRLLGRDLGVLYIAGMGDLIEQCSGNYSIQTFTVELNHRDQMKVTTRLLLKAVRRWSRLFEKVVVVAVGGNHGEHRQNGKKFTDDADNDDVAVFETVALVLNENPAYDHVKFVIPKEDLVQVLDISGTLVAFTHGHLKGGKGGALPQAGQWSWWKDQMGGGLPAGDATVLVTGHFHHFSAIDHGPRLHLQCPAMDCGSKWYKDLAGKDSKRGTLTFTVGPNGVDDIKIV